MRHATLLNERVLSTLPALALAISCIATPARASPEPDPGRAEQSRAEQSRTADRETDEIIVLVGLNGTLVSQIGAGGASYSLGGYGVLVGQRHGRWLTSELRGDLLYDDRALSGSVQAALAYDPGGRLSPVVGAWMGYRGTTVELDRPLDDGAAETAAHDALLGLEVGGRLRYGPLMGELMAQGATAALSSRETRGAPGGEAVQFGDIAELSVAARIGLSF